MTDLVQWDFVDRQPGVITARQDRVELAIHEAAHAVVAAMLGMGVLDDDAVTIIDTENGAEGVTPIGHLPIEATASEHIIISVAGNAAVECLMPGLVRSPDDETLAGILKEVRLRISHTPPDQAFEANGKDEEMALAFLEFCYPNLNDATVIEHYRDAEALTRGWVLTEPVRGSIEAVMTTLIHRSTISGLMVRQIAECHGLIPQVHS